MDVTVPSLSRGVRFTGPVRMDPLFAAPDAAATTGPNRYPAIAAAKLRAKSFTLDGETVVCGTDGVAVFDAAH
jgi:hypothetical protein